MSRLINALISERMVMTVVLLNAAVMTASGFYAEGDPTKKLLDGIDYGCVVYFVIEVILKLRQVGWKGYFSSGWNRFDFVVTLFCLPILAGPWLDPTHRLGFVPIFRTGRLFRLFRLLRFIPNATHLLVGIHRALRASVGIFLALFLINLIIALTATYFFAEMAPEQFGNPALSFYSIFRIFTIEGWYEYPDALESMATSPAWLIGIRVFFMASVLGGGMLGFSLANAVFLDEMTMDNNRELEAKVDRLSEQISALQKQLSRSGPLDTRETTEWKS